MSGGDGRRSAVIAVVSTVAVFTLLAVAITHAPGWPEVRRTFFDGAQFKDSLPDIARAFVLNIKIFTIAEAFILVFALLLAVIRSLPGPAALPFRLLAIAYADFFRGVPTILVIAMLGFGAPALQLQGVPRSTTFWGIVSLVLVYTAYVSEVYRAGIESVHPSQRMAARSLGLTYAQALRYVVLPQAIRRVVPPLLNDFIGLQKDTAIITVIGVVEALNLSQQFSTDYGSFTGYTVAALFFIFLTIPLARFTDHLIAERERRERALAM
jgi:polar amino acid transport system permease protein